MGRQLLHRQHLLILDRAFTGVLLLGLFASLPVVFCVVPDSLY